MHTVFVFMDNEYLHLKGLNKCWVQEIRDLNAVEYTCMAQQRVYRAKIHILLNSESFV